VEAQVIAADDPAAGVAIAAAAVGRRRVD
jgi:hypothetical protein